jgi:Tol biopolymer transport system component
MWGATSLPRRRSRNHGVEFPPSSMALAAGTRLGPYEILAPLGAGGMGEVYKAKDTRLGREVAVKVLPASFLDDPDRLRRFELEARAASALNHPNIVTLHDIGEGRGAPYVVTELLEGETLRSRLAGGALAPRKATEYAIQIAQGLAAAHEKGIVHRDLKPENLFVTNDGRVKILDFGLARVTEPDAGGPSGTQLPTVTAGTEPGLVLGTLGYMSPEQVRGKKADARSDIFAFGTVLYEMLSGRRAFHGETAADTMSAILTKEPQELSESGQKVSEPLERLVRHCLEKSPEARFQAASDIAFDLEAISGAPPSAPAALDAGRGAWTRRAATGLAIVLAATGLGLWLGRETRSAPPAVHAIRSTLLLPERVTFGCAAVSPDGTQLAIAGIGADGRRGLWLRSLESNESRLLTGTEGGNLPFWSPDSRSIGFFNGAKLMRIEASGGPPIPLTEDFGVSASWGPKGDILFSDDKGPIYRIPASGGKRVVVTQLGPHETSHRYPQFLPDGRHFLYMAFNLEGSPRDEANRVHVASLDSAQDRVVMHAYSRTTYSQGYLLYSRGGDAFGPLMAQRFDPNRLEAQGEPVTLAERVGVFDDYYQYSSLTASETGVLVFDSELLSSRFVWLDRAGRQVGEFGEPAIVAAPRISPDGRQLAYTLYEPTGSSDIWVGDLTRGVQTRLTKTASNDHPVWSPDGGRIAFDTNRSHQGDVYVIATNGSGKEEPLNAGPGQKYPEDWSPGGQFIVENATGADDTRTPTIWILPTSGDRKPSVFVRGNASTAIFGDSRFSPDGKWIAYASEESGRGEVYVASFPGRETTLQVSSAGGRWPIWRRDGKELFYVTPDGTLMSVAVTGSPRLAFGVPKPLLHLPSGSAIGIATPYDVAPDGERFLIRVPVVRGTSWPLSLITNWTALLRDAR